jgi:hypothetical protein
MLGMWALVRHLTGSSLAGVAPGIAFAFCPHVFSHLPHIQLLMSAGLPFSLLAMHRFVERQTAGRAIGLGIIVGVQGLSCGYYGVFAALLVTPGIVFYGCRSGHWRRWTYWAWASAAGLVAIGVVLPFFLPYLEMQTSTGFARTVAETRQWSAGWSAYLASAAWAHRWLVPFLPPFKEVLFPGTLALVGGVAGAAWLWRARARDAAGVCGRDHLWFYGGTVLVMGWASFGPDAGLYYLLHETIPLFQWIRAPSRLGFLVGMGLAVLAGFAVRWVLARVARPALAVAALAALTVGDIVIAPLNLQEAEPVAAAYESLKRRPYGPVAEFPFFYLRMDFPRHAYYMLNSTFHWRPLVNGYSDFIPPEFRQMVVPVSSFPNDESFAILKPYRVRYAVFHMNLYSRSAWKAVEARLEEYRAYLKPIRKEDPVWLFEIVAWPPSR